MDLVESGSDIAGHPVFQVGLPHDNSNAPSTEDELEQFQESLKTTAEISQRYLAGTVGEENRLHASGAAYQEPRSEWCTRTWEVPRSNAQNQYGGRGKRIENSFATLVDKLGSKASSLTSMRGEPVKFFYAIPIAWWSLSLEEKPKWQASTSAWEASPGGGLFFGSSRELTSEEARFLASYCADSVGAGYRHVQALEQGERTGAEAAVDVFAHQVRTLAGKVSNGWLVNSEDWNALEKPDGFRGDKVIPLPQLYEAVSSVLTLWSMSIEPDHLFPRQVREQSASNESVCNERLIRFPPENVHDIARYAMFHARQSVLVGRCENLKLSNPESLRAAWRQVNRGTNIAIEFLSDERSCLIDKDHFDDKFRLDKDDPVSIARFSELSGVMRLMTVLFENFLQSTNQEDKIKIHAIADTELGGITLTLSFANPRGRVFERISKASHVGARSRSVIRFIAEKFLNGCEVQIKDNESDSECREFKSIMNIRNISWIEN
ncbi:hypothetical protein [Aporhodopirellula aestuarii]|uniref:Uncharacterized protein n=1 Tax=Aporhodopirellula aestuarii TaxID=2950107 RepID=A0ABT0UDV8_9BACT|nr:hypothetical protein [Aporhodopirellula aestuarii]MCM2374650.1 hypothetical protein [Aporhodopirellula aestuarii]